MQGMAVCRPGNGGSGPLQDLPARLANLFTDRTTEAPCASDYKHERRTQALPDEIWAFARS